MPVLLSTPVQSDGSYLFRWKVVRILSWMEIGYLVILIGPCVKFLLIDVRTKFNFWGAILIGIPINWFEANR